MSIIDTLITDRTEADVAKIRTLLASGPFSSWSAEDQNWWFYGEPEALSATDGDLYATDGLLIVGEGVHRGAYNYTDLNRVGEACAYLYALLTDYGYAVSGYTALPTDWALEDIPTATQMATYLSTVAALQAVLPIEGSIPASMDELSVDGANAIEEVLAALSDAIQRMAATVVYSGQPYSGQIWAQFTA